MKIQSGRGSTGIATILTRATLCQRSDGCWKKAAPLLADISTSFREADYFAACMSNIGKAADKACVVCFITLILYQIKNYVSTFLIYNSAYGSSNAYFNLFFIVKCVKIQT